MPQGIIKLMIGEEVLAANSYSTVQVRHSVIDKWRKIYGKKFEKCYFQIEPKVNTERKEVLKYKKRNGKYVGKTYSIKNVPPKDESGHRIASHIYIK